ncbi:MAG: hypothetical protein JWM67_820 [Mycobacterium sp.]|nr:hypothetical protein [Mycobacterium sp.]
MVRLLLSPKWLLRHVLLVAAVIACIRLGMWQWGRSQSSSGTMQNLGYSMEWPLIAGFFVLVWFKALRFDRARQLAGGEEPQTAEVRPLIPGARDGEQGSATADLPLSLLRPGQKLMTHQQAEQRRREDEEDPEVVAWNRMLAELSAGAEQQGRP